VIDLAALRRLIASKRDGDVAIVSKRWLQQVEQDLSKLVCPKDREEIRP